MSKKRGFSLIKSPPGATIQRKMIRKQVTKQMQKVAKKHVKVRDQLTKNWSEKNRPDFDVETEQNPNSITVRVTLEANDAKSARLSVYELLDEGTDVRYAQMSHDFKAKTTPGSLVSGSGQGSFLYVDTNLPHEEGIDAREFDETANDKLHKEMLDSITRGYKEGFAEVKRASK